VTGKEIAGNQGGTMKNTQTHGTQGQLARIGRRFAAIVAECNRAQTLVASPRNTPAHF
jgi:hypothetical protein